MNALGLADELHEHHTRGRIVLIWVYLDPDLLCGSHRPHLDSGIDHRQGPLMGGYFY